MMIFRLSGIGIEASGDGSEMARSDENATLIAIFWTSDRIGRILILVRFWRIFSSFEGFWRGFLSIDSDENEEKDIGSYVLRCSDEIFRSDLHIRSFDFDISRSIGDQIYPYHIQLGI